MDFIFFPPHLLNRIHVKIIMIDKITTWHIYLLNDRCRTRMARCNHSPLGWSVTWCCWALLLADHPQMTLTKSVITSQKQYYLVILWLNYTPSFPIRPSLPDSHTSCGCPRVQRLNNTVNTHANLKDLQ